jgi:glycosyltransferase involved in cell wall biosynthesis
MTETERSTPMKVTLISTVKDCAGSADAFLASLGAQTRAPDEVVIVDGGSSDGTAEAYARGEGVSVLVEPGANISRGRNVAIAAATHDVIAATDADCELDPRWLEAVVAPIEAGADVSMGWYEPVLETAFERCMAAVNLPLAADEVDPATFAARRARATASRPGISARGAARRAGG